MGFVWSMSRDLNNEDVFLTNQVQMGQKWRAGGRLQAPSSPWLILGI